jgi:hypothetical protein
VPVLEAAFNVPCPVCYAGIWKPCISRHAVRVHQGRRDALADLEKRADELLGVREEKKPRKKRKRKPGRPRPVKPGVERQTTLFGVTGKGSVIPEYHGDVPPWEAAA